MTDVISLVIFGVSGLLIMWRVGQVPDSSVGRGTKIAIASIAIAMVAVLVSIGAAIIG